jgi:hypothetical protein
VSVYSPSLTTQRVFNLQYIHIVKLMVILDMLNKISTMAIHSLKELVLKFVSVRQLNHGSLW